MWQLADRNRTDGHRIISNAPPSPIANTQLGLFGDDKTIVPAKGRSKVTANKFIINEVGDMDGDGAFTLKDIAEQLKAIYTKAMYHS